VIDPRIERRPANELVDDTDLGARLVTVNVPPLDQHLVQEALDAGTERADLLVKQGLIWGALLALQGSFRVIGGDAGEERETSHDRRPAYLHAGGGDPARVRAAS
jgi:uncharacterized protein